MKTPPGRVESVVRGGAPERGDDTWGHLDGVGRRCYKTKRNTRKAKVPVARQAGRETTLRGVLRAPRHIRLVKEVTMLASRNAVAGVLSSLILLVLTALAPAAGANAFSTGPSHFCHVTDGVFTDCTPGDEVEEWSDVSFLAGLGTSAGAIVYTDQSVSPPRLLLMYDLLLHQQPLAPGSFFDVSFNVVEDGEFEQYEVRCFGNNTFQVFENGMDITGQASTVDCAVGFNGHNVQVELEIDTLVTYSPDIPLFWSTAAPRPERCPPTD